MVKRGQKPRTFLEKDEQLFEINDAHSQAPKSIYTYTWMGLNITVFNVSHSIFLTHGAKHGKVIGKTETVNECWTDSET